jgi:hypothetical protein
MERGRPTVETGGLPFGTAIVLEHCLRENHSLGAAWEVDRRRDGWPARVAHSLSTPCLLVLRLHTVMDCVENSNRIALVGKGTL